jgi:hypothetical protein
MSLFDLAIINNSQTLETPQYRRSINSNILNPLQLLWKRKWEHQRGEGPKEKKKNTTKIVINLL